MAFDIFVKQGRIIGFALLLNTRKINRPWIGSKQRIYINFNPRKLWLWFKFFYKVQYRLWKHEHSTTKWVQREMCGIIKFFSAMSDGFIHENSYADDINSISCNISKYQNIMNMQKMIDVVLLRGFYLHSSYFSIFVYRHIS